MKSKIIQLHPDDNVAVLIADVKAEEVLNEDSITSPKDLTLGHKIAIKSIASGEKILKCGLPIGSATQDLAAGSWVHLHNMKSDYVPTYVFDGSDKQE